MAMSRWFQTLVPLGIAALLLSVVVIGSGSVLAGKGGNRQIGVSSIVLNQPATTDLVTGGEFSPGLGDAVSFTTVAAGLAGWEYPMVAVWCYQGDVLVYMELAAPDSVFVLGGGSSDWLTSGGAAECVANLYAYGTTGSHESIRILADLSFPAAE
jgi:hypothetical protein